MAVDAEQPPAAAPGGLFEGLGRPLLGLGEGIAGLQLPQQPSEDFGGGPVGHPLAEHLDPGHPGRQGAMGQVDAQAAVEQHQAETPVHRPPQRPLQAGTGDPAAVTQLQPPSPLRGSVAVAEEEQGIPARFLRQHRLQRLGPDRRAPQDAQRLAAPAGQALQLSHLRLEIEILLVAHHQQQPSPARARHRHRLRGILGRQPPERSIQGQGLPGQLLKGAQLRRDPQPQGQARLEPQGPVQGEPAFVLEPLPQTLGQLIAVVVQHRGGQPALAAAVVVHEAAPPGRMRLQQRGGQRCGEARLAGRTDHQHCQFLPTLQGLEAEVDAGHQALIRRIPVRSSPWWRRNGEMAAPGASHRRDRGR